MTTIGTTTQMGGSTVPSGCTIINRLSERIVWPTPKQLADREKRNRMRKMKDENNYMQNWDPDDPGKCFRECDE